jgi:hypothetical protein
VTSGCRNASDSALPAKRWFTPPKRHLSGLWIDKTYRPMNGQPMLPKWPNDGSSHKLRAEPGKQKPRSCRTQELARSSAQENEWQKKRRLLNSAESAEEQDHVSNCSGETVHKSIALKGVTREEVFRPGRVTRRREWPAILTTVRQRSRRSRSCSSVLSAWEADLWGCSGFNLSRQCQRLTYSSRNLKTSGSH